MKIRAVTFCATLLVLLVGAVAASAAAQQPQQRLLSPRALDPADPRAQRVAGLVQLILAGDADAALAHAGDHAAPPLWEEASFERDLRALVAEFGTGDFLVESIDDAGPELAVARLRNTAGGESAALLVGTEPAPPHRFTRVRTARIQVRRLDG